MAPATKCIVAAVASASVELTVMGVVNACTLHPLTHLNPMCALLLTVCMWASLWLHCCQLKVYNMYAALSFSVCSCLLMTTNPKLPPDSASMDVSDTHSDNTADHITWKWDKPHVKSAIVSKHNSLIFLQSAKIATSLSIDDLLKGQLKQITNRICHSSYDPAEFLMGG